MPGSQLGRERTGDAGRPGRVSRQRWRSTASGPWTLIMGFHHVSPAFLAPPKESLASVGTHQHERRWWCASHSRDRRRPRSRTGPACRPARSPTGPLDRVIAALGAAIRVSMCVHDPAGHVLCRHDHRCLRHTSRAGRPKHGRSTSSTGVRSFTLAWHPHARHHARPGRDSTCTAIAAPRWSSTAKTFTSGKPTSSSHMRVGSVSTGAPMARQA
jgi:hypothetical protein